MRNEITGKVLAIGQPLQLPSKEPNKPFVKRELTLDCTRHDPYTGERSRYENTPMLEFAGDICGELDNIKVGDIVTITFEVVGSKYVDKTTKAVRIFTRIRPYKIETVLSSQPQPQQVQQPQQNYQQDPFGQRLPFDEPPF